MHSALLLTSRRWIIHGKSDNVFEPEVKIVDFRRPIVTIPNLAIHMNNGVNKGVELNK